MKNLLTPLALCFTALLGAQTCFAAPAMKDTNPKETTPTDTTPKEATPPTTVMAPAEAAKPAEAAPEFKPTRSLVFKTTTNADGEKVELMLHVFEPAGHKATDKTPAMVFYFGGGWTGGSVDLFFPHCAYFASRGMVAFAPDYRIKNTHHTTPYESVADAKSAMRYIRGHAADFGIDPDRIAAGGSSAGGHVAACCGIVPGFDEPNEDATISAVPNALVLYNPVIDTSENGYAHKRLGERWREISPLHHVRPGLPPTIVFHSKADKTVPYKNAADFDAAMRAAGNRCELVTFTGVGHGFVYKLSNPYANRSVRDTDRFLASLGYTQGEPTMEEIPGAK